MSPIPTGTLDPRRAAFDCSAPSRQSLFSCKRPRTRSKVPVVIRLRSPFSLNRTPDAINNSYTTTEMQSVPAMSSRKTQEWCRYGSESDALTVTAVNGVNANVGQTITLASGATLIVNANGSYTYTPGTVFNNLAVGSSVDETFTYTVRDANGGVDTSDSHDTPYKVRTMRSA